MPEYLSFCLKLKSNNSKVVPSSDMFLSKDKVTHAMAVYLEQ